MTIKELADRVTVLEQTQCRCATCVEHARAREQEAIAAEAHAIAALDLDQRLEALQALAHVRFSRIVEWFGRDVLVATALAAPDELRARLLSTTRDQLVRDMVAAELLARDRKLPQRVCVENVSGIRDRFPARTLRVTPAAAKELRAAGLNVRTEKRETSTVHKIHSTELGYRREWTIPQWTALLAVDDVLREGVANREISVRELTHDENVQRWIADEQERRSAPAFTGTASYV